MPLPSAADLKTVNFVIHFCITNLGAYQLEKIILFGSRANGEPMSNSDHDFMAIVADSAPDEIRTGGTLHAKMFSKLESERRAQGFGPIDLLVTRSRRFYEAESGTHAFEARTKGVQVFPL